MRKKKIFSALLSLFLLVPASITWAQTISSQKGLTTAVFTTSGGTIKLYLPDDIRPGDLISGRVIAEPIGKNAKQTANNLSELKKYFISINNEKIAVDNTNKPFQFLVNADRPMTGQIALFNASGIKAGELSIPAVPEKNQQTAPPSCKIPSHGLTGAPFRITGPFDGNSSNTNCTLDNNPMEILAKSPRECIVLYPADATGIKTLNIQESGKQICSQQVSGVQMKVSAGKLDLLKGEKTYIDVSITGLQHLPDTALLSLTNSSTDIVAMLPSNVIVIPLSPDSVGAGTFNKTFDIQSIRTGTFSVNVNLELPEVEADYPPTKPQPGNNPQPKDSTQPQPPHDSTTVLQCPGCTCSCSATIILKSTKDGESTYSAVVVASCKGKSGPPPCKDCHVIDDDDHLYEWHLIDANGKSVKVGVNYPEVTINNKNAGEYTLFVTVTVRCSDGHQCSCEAKTIIHPPTIPIGVCPGCECKCDVSIKAADKQGDFWSYFAIVNAVCTGKFGNMPNCENCKWVKTTWLWTMPLGEGKVAKFADVRNGPAVGVIPIKKGKFTLHVEITVTCSDGHTCTCDTEINDEVPDDGCILSWKEMMEPKMTGGLDPSSLTSLKPKLIRRDDFISLKAVGRDTDYIKFFCTSIDCQDITSSVKYQRLSGMVKFAWNIEGESATGSFVKIGCLPDNEKTDIGENVIFKPPFVPLPTGKDAAGKDILETKVWTDIQLFVIDADPGKPITDKTVERNITITTTRTKANPDFYEVSIRQTEKMPDEGKFKTEDAKGVCEVEISRWTDATAIEVPVINLPELPNNNQLISGEWIRLEANEQTDKDHLHANCITRHDCIMPRVFDKDYADSLEWVWTVNIGRFVSSNDITDKGRCVIYEAPLGITNKTEIIFTVTVDDKNSSKFDDPAKSASLTIMAYPGGVKLNYPAPDWLPDPDKPATLKSFLVYKDDILGWQPAFKHVRRIHFFELMDVSTEKGICLNSPISKEAKTCRDLLLKSQADLELIDLNKLMKDETLKNKCEPDKYLLEARTANPENNYEIKVHSEDYGSFGFLRSFANLNMHSETEQKKQTPYYESVKVKKEDVRHPYVHLGGERMSKRTVYEDNRVNIPMDIDENHIPDNGWVYAIVEEKGGGKTILSMPDFTDDIKIDNDNEPKGDGVFGDGLSFYEEYRGFNTIGEDGTIKHIRTNPNVKDLFINNEDNLRMDIFDTITGLNLHKINADLYNGNEDRNINFNNSTGHLDFEQKGIWLIDGTGMKPADLCEPEKKDDSDPVVLLGISCPVIIVNKAKSRREIEKPGPPNWIRKVVVYKGRIAQNAKGLGYNAIEKEKQVVAHELCHALNVYHHGESNTTPGLASGDNTCVMRYDHIGGAKNDLIGINLCNVIKGAAGDYRRGNCKEQIRVSGNPAIIPVDRMKKK